MPKGETLNTRVTRLEESQERAFDGIHKLEQNIERMRALNEERDRKTDERIGTLVVAIGELIQEMRRGFGGM